jgi:uncharacterized membrane protein YfcA
MDQFNLPIDILLTTVAFIAGTIDALAGGGGLITVPALLMTGMNPVMALGTNKLQSAIGEFSAVLHFMKQKQVSYSVLTFGLIFTIIGSIIGTIALQITPIKQLEKIIPFLLLGILIYYIINQHRKNTYSNEYLQPSNKRFFYLGSVIGFYNGFFGPGTGSIWAIALMKVFKLGLKKATIYAKPLNLVGNLTALSIFIIGGQIDFIAAFLMGCGSFIGGRFGANLVMYKNLQWLKAAFLSLMIISTAATFIKYF